MTHDHFSSSERRRLKGAAPGYVIALMVTVAGGAYKVHDTIEADAQRDRYENLQQHCTEREIDAMRAHLGDKP